MFLSDLSPIIAWPCQADSQMLLRLEWSEDDNSLSVVYIIADFYWQPDNSLLIDSLMFTLLLLDDC